MFENPDTKRQIVIGRLENGLRDAADRRLARGSRVRAHHHIRPRMPRVTWFSRSARPAPAPAPKPTTA